MGFGRGARGSGPGKKEREQRKEVARQAALTSWRKGLERQRRGGPPAGWKDAWSLPYNRDGDRYCGSCDKVLFKDEARAGLIVAERQAEWGPPDRDVTEKRTYACPVAPRFKERHLTSWAQPPRRLRP